MSHQCPTTDTPHILPGPHFRSEVPSVEIEILRGRARQLFRQVSGRVFLIGTAADCDMVLGDLQFPEVYAYLFLSEQGVSLRYLEAGPALMVNGRLVQAAAIFDGDVLRMANYEFVIHIEWDDRPQKRKSPISRSSQATFQDPESLEQVEELLCDVRGALQDLIAFEDSNTTNQSGKVLSPRPIFSHNSGRATA